MLSPVFPKLAVGEQLQELKSYSHLCGCRVQQDKFEDERLVEGCESEDFLNVGLSAIRLVVSALMKSLVNGWLAFHKLELIAIQGYGAIAR